MSHWNYRVMRNGDEVAIHEVFYRDDGSVRGWTATPVWPRAGTVEELRDELARYARALDEPVLDGEAA